MKANLKMGISIGGPTIIMIFVVLCLTTLGTLSLVTANADLKLTQKTVVSTAEYYAADNQGELFLSQVDAALIKKNAADLIGKFPETAVVKNQSGSLSISHAININARQKLVIDITSRIANPANSSPPVHYAINTWKVVNIDYWHYEDYQTKFQDAIPQNK